ncbi:MAG: TolC family protein [Candidatus Eisenbacteria bacterium]
MRLKYLILFVLAPAVALSGCTTPHVNASRSEARPLGSDFETFQAPEEPSEVSVPAGPEGPTDEEPTGIIDMRQALAQALINSPELAAFSWEVRASEAAAVQAGLFPNPEIGVEMENFGGSGEFEGFDGSETTFRLSQLIELGGKRSGRARVAALDLNLAGWDYESKRLEVVSEATKAFVDVLAAQERLALTEELEDLADEVFNVVRERVRHGKVSPVEEARAGVVLASSRIETEKAGRELEASRKRLAAIWGSSSPAFESVSGELEVIESIPPAGTVARHVSRNPDIVRWAAEMEQREAALDLEKARRIPDLTLSGGVKHFREMDINAFVVDLSIPLPLFDRNQGGTREARYRLAKASEERRASEVRVRTALAETHLSLSAAYAQAVALRDDVLPGATTAFEAASEGYRLGKFNYLDVLDAQRTLFKAREQYIETLAAYHKASVDVERLIGERLDAVKNTPE